MDKRKDDGIFIKKVLRYYKENGRHNLLWREKISPYKILVSEIMLQQTQVRRVLPKFTLWMREYPTLAALKKASLKDILLLWQGLGYQRRAKALHDISNSVTRLPKTFNMLCDLPGIGRYTASALCAFAYDSLGHPLLETNIRTVLIEEYHQGKEKVDDKLLYDDLIRLEACSTVKKVGARMWYYALMDYGAYLKSLRISHNKKSLKYFRQKPYKGSTRELRAKILFAIAHKNSLPEDIRAGSIIKILTQEGYILKNRSGYVIQENTRG